MRSHCSYRAVCWFAIYAVPILEAEFGVPVLLTITSTMWAALRAVQGPRAVHPGGASGKLLASLPGCSNTPGAVGSIGLISKIGTASRIVIQRTDPRERDVD
jgi:hypothetical protein